MKTFRIASKEYSASDVVAHAAWGRRWFLYIALFTLVDALRPFWRAMWPVFHGKTSAWIFGSSITSHIATEYVSASPKSVFGLLAVFAVALVLMGFYLTCW